MGPYCKYCQQRCFVYMPQGTPQEALDAYGASTIVATCRMGEAFEMQQTGWNYQRIKETLKAEKQRASERQCIAVFIDQRPEVPALNYDEEDDQFFFQPDHGPAWIITREMFQSAVQTYMEQYRVSETRATEIAMQLQQWHKDQYSVFYSI